VSRRRRSLQSRVLVWGLGLLALGVVLAVVLGVLTYVVQARLTQLTKSLVEEQRLADRITGGVMRQLAAQTAPSGDGSRPFEQARAEFNGAGEQVKAALGAYLLRELSVQARQQLERVKERHRQMEVSALLAMNTDGAFGEESRVRLEFHNGPDARVLSLSRVLAADTRLALQAQATTYAVDLLGALNTFRRLRDDDVAIREAEFQEELQTLWFARLFFIGGFTTLVVVLMLRGTRRRIAEPLAALRGVSQRLGRGELDVRAPELADAELQALGQAFNQMAGELAEAQRVLRQRNDELEQALHEVQATQRDLLEAEKLGAVGRMTAGLAHELNNPLATVVGLTDLLAQECRDDRVFTSSELQQEFIAPVLAQATRASKLVRSLLAVSRRGGAVVEAVSIPGVLGAVLDLRRHGFEQMGLTLTCSAVPDCHVEADAQQLQSIFLNVVNNALDAMRDRGTGTLHVTCEVVDRVVTICFDDTGPGLEEPNLVFEPFFTTKGVGEGTGLGLWLSRRFVEAAGGTLRAENRPGGGARFRLTLPITEGASRTPADAAPAVVRPVSVVDRTVLVIDDEPDLRTLAARAIGRLGVTVLTAASGAEARRLLASGPTVDAIVSDVRMPGESGIELYHWVRETYPHLATRVLFVTGDMSDDLLSSLPEEVQGQVLLKPFALADYLTRIQALLA
jgi:signal transduction histidine kinase